MGNSYAQDVTNVLLPHLAACVDIELEFSKRCIILLMMAMKSDNVFCENNH